MVTVQPAVGVPTDAAAEVLATASITWLVVQTLRRFRSSPWPLPAGGAP